MATQSDCLREAIKLLTRARNLVPRTLLVAGAESELDGSDDDCDALLKKWTASQERIDAFLETLEEVE